MTALVIIAAVVMVVVATWYDSEQGRGPTSPRRALEGDRTYSPDFMRAYLARFPFEDKCPQTLKTPTRY